MSTRPVPLDCIDALHLLRDELHVVWCALLCENHAEECIIPISEAVNGIKDRLARTLKQMEGVGRP